MALSAGAAKKRCQNQKYKQFLKIYFSGYRSTSFWGKKDQNYDVGEHLNEVVQKADNFPHKYAYKKILVSKNYGNYGAAITSPITNQMPQGCFELVN